jgi:hypothetical protein
MVLVEVDEPLLLCGDEIANPKRTPVRISCQPARSRLFSNLPEDIDHPNKLEGIL